MRLEAGSSFLITNKSSRCLHIARPYTVSSRCHRTKQSGEQQETLCLLLSLHVVHGHVPVTCVPCGRQLSWALCWWSTALTVPSKHTALGSFEPVSFRSIKDSPMCCFSHVLGSRHQALYLLLTNLDWHDS